MVTEAFHFNVVFILFTWWLLLLSLGDACIAQIKEQAPQSLRPLRDLFCLQLKPCATDFLCDLCNHFNYFSIAAIIADQSPISRDQSPFSRRPVSIINHRPVSAS